MFYFFYEAGARSVETLKVTAEESGSRRCRMFCDFPDSLILLFPNLNTLPPPAIQLKPTPLPCLKYESLKYERDKPSTL